MKKIIAILVCLLFTASFTSCKAQQVYPLNTNQDEIPNYSYIKDTYNQLPQFVGEYHANYDGKLIKLFLTEVDNKLVDYIDKKFYHDVIEIRFIIQNNGVILQDTQNLQQIAGQNEIESFGFRGNTNNILVFGYTGTNCGIGWGKIVLKKLNTTQLSWEYRPNSRVLDDDCPSGTNKTVYLPVTKDLIFTKQ